MKEREGAADCRAFPHPIVAHQIWQKAAVVLVHAFVLWALCGATIAIARSITTLHNALTIHALAVPIFAAAVSWFYYRKFSYTTPIQTALAFVSFVILLDAGLVAPVFEKSFAMFRSFIGTWLPFLLIFLSTFATGVFLRRSNRI